MVKRLIHVRVSRATSGVSFAGFLIHCLSIVLVAIAAFEACADDPRPGDKAHVYINAHFATGYWAGKEEMPGCPVIHEPNETKVAVYVTKANDRTLQVAVALDGMLQQYPQLDRSFFIVSDENRETAMTDEELAAMMASLRDLAEHHRLDKLSLGGLQYNPQKTRWKNALGFFGSADVVIAVIEPDIARPLRSRRDERYLPVRRVFPVYRYVAKLGEDEITEVTARAAIMDALSSLGEVDPASHADVSP